MVFSWASPSPDLMKGKEVFLWNIWGCLGGGQSVLWKTQGRRGEAGPGFKAQGNINREICLSISPLPVSCLFGIGREEPPSPPLPTPQLCGGRARPRAAGVGVGREAN